LTSTIPDQINYEITFLRHGESVGNAQGYYQGQHDFPLTEKGIEQAYTLSQLWRYENKNFELVITSPLTRALQTAEILSQALHVPLETNPLWLERDAGKISGMNPEDADEKYPKPDFTNIYQPLGLTGESRWQLYLRAGQAIENLIGRLPGSYLVVSHGGLLNMALYAILGIAPQANTEGAHFYFYNASFAELTYYPEINSWIMKKFNNC
jgi:broad specificity phosphatase PhoE